MSVCTGKMGLCQQVLPQSIRVHGNATGTLKIMHSSTWGQSLYIHWNRACSCNPILSIHVNHHCLEHLKRTNLSESDSARRNAFRGFTPQPIIQIAICSTPIQNMTFCYTTSSPSLLNSGNLCLWGGKHHKPKDTCVFQI